MSELTITAKGQVTLKRAVLEHLGIGPGGKVRVSLLPGGRVTLAPAAAAADIRQLRGALRRRVRRAVSLEQMQKAIESGGR
ncbi:MAG TPA: AbrB/MazE/SpoVT family DNA-binding domain-containing protein [Rhizomicrobium sp.]|jgi:bifunctional DNA-binding transcriptional regulator/antitoxin component of YhaV-PrlF toxin-antitoxin module|nr:AbrB/MazE/SpoVT family DNA-binding domain-containing protein [Rhizomicrobium sp.]